MRWLIIRRFFAIIFAIYFAALVVASAPTISFVDPTPSNATNISEGGSVVVNVSLTEANLTNFTWNWGSVASEMYGGDLLVMMNMDNVSALGEDDTTVVDLTGNGYDGTVVDAFVTGSGKYGGAYNFNGTSSGINLGDIEMDSWAEITVSAWAKTSDSVNDQRIIAKDQVGTAGNFMLFFYGGEWKWQVRDGGVWRTATVPSSLYNDGEWHHFVGVVDNDNNLIRFFVDGGQVATDTFSATDLDDSDNEELVIGADSDLDNGFGHVFNGDIDEVRVYDRGLDASEVTQLYGANLRQFDEDSWTFTVNEENLVDGTYLYDAYAEDVDGNSSSTETRTLIVEDVPEPVPEFTMWTVGDPHIQTDFPFRSYEAAINDTLYGGDEGGEQFNWTLSLNMGDWTGGPCPDGSDGQDVISQFDSAFSASSLDQNYVYGIIGNHDGSTEDNWFKKWIDPLGTNTSNSGINNTQRPYPTRGEWNRYYFEVGNVLFLMLQDWNEPNDKPFGRECGGGSPAGRVTNDTYNWWVQMIESHPEHIIISTFHQALINTTAYTNLFEGTTQGIHGNHSWADSRGSSMLYAIDNWTVDGLNASEDFIGNRPYGFKKYIEDNPGAIDFWIHGHTHTDLTPLSAYNGNSMVEKKDGVNFINTGALTIGHADPIVPFSRYFQFYNNSNQTTMKTYLHESGWAGNAEGFYDGVGGEYDLTMNHEFTPGYLVSGLDAGESAESSDQLEDYSVDRQFWVNDVLMSDNGTKVVEFNANFTSELDWSDVVVDSDAALGKSVAYLNRSNKAEIVQGNVTLYVPVVSDSGDVLVCPNAEVLSDVTGGCSGGYQLSGLTSSGGFYEISVNEGGAIESNPPVLSYVAPTANDSATLQQDFIEVNVTAIDESLDTVIINLFNSSGDQIDSASGTSPSLYVNFSGLADGGYSYNASANDTEGNVGELNDRTITLDSNLPPSILNTYPEFDAVLPNGTVSVTINATTDENAICRYDASDVAWENMTEFTNTNSTVHDFSASVADGQTYNYYFLCEDDLGERMTSSHHLRFSVDNNATFSLAFVDPTPVNEANLSESSDATINVSIDGDLDELTWNWNGTNNKIMSDSLVAAINFDNIAAIGDNSTLASDISGNGNDGIVEGAVYTSAGKYDGAYSFDGSADAVDLGYIDAENWDGLTISAWANTTDSSNIQRIVAKDQVGVQGNFMLWFNGGQWRFWVHTGSAWAKADWVSTGPNNGEWHHFAGVVDTVNDEIRLLVDNVERASASFTSNTLDDSDLEEIVIGADSDETNGRDHVFNGQIDDVRIYNASMNDTELTQQYYSSLAKFDVEEWKFVTTQENLQNGTYTYSASGVDVDSNNAATEIRAVNIGIGGPQPDTEDPSVSIVNPVSGENYTSASDLDYTVSDNVALNSCWYTTDGGSTNTTITCGNNVTGLSASEGSNTWAVYADDTSTNEGSDSVTFTIDSINPSVTNLIPVADTDYNQSEVIEIAADVTDGGVGISSVSADVTLPNGTVNQVTLSLASGDKYNVSFSATSLVGRYNVSYSASDGVSNTNDSETSFFDMLTAPDVTPPSILNTYPINGSSLASGTTSVVVNATTNENAICRQDTADSAWENMTEFTNTNATVHNFTATGLSDGQTYDYYFLCEDDSLNRMTSSHHLRFSVDATPGPNFVEFVDPTPANGSSVSSGNDVTVNVSVSEGDITDFTWNWNGSSYAIMNESLVGIWNFNKVTALGENDTLVKDVIGSGNDGVVTGATFTSDGKYGGAYSFDGSDGSGISMGDIEMEDYTGLTISAWINTTETTGQMRVVAKDQVGTQGNFILWFNNNKWTFQVHTGSGWATASWTSTAPNNGEWHQIMGRVDTVQNKVKLDVDGVNRASATFNSNTLNDAENEEVVIGADSDLDNGYQHVFNGVIDDVRIYNSSMMAADITQQYYSTLYKYDTDAWAFLTTQQSPADATYLYSASATESAGSTNSTETRSVTVG